MEQAFDRIVVVADLRREISDETPSGPVQSRKDLEQTDSSVLDDLLDALAALGLGTVHYEGPEQLAENAAQHRGDLVLSIYGGAGSRNRMLLVPAVCETFGLSYVGLDAFGRALAQDKEASKDLARRSGMLTPQWRVIRSPEDLEVCDEFPLPYVVKPLLEGSSIGIGPENLIREAGAGRRLAARLLDEFQQPVLVETFVPGREISFAAIETTEGISLHLAEIAVDGDPTYFENHLFDAEEKVHRRLPRRAVRVDDELVVPEDWSAARRLLQSLGHFGYARVDGRVAGGRFHFIEVTPDAFIGPRGHMAAGFIGNDLNYAGFMDLVLRSASLRPRVPPANG